MAGNIFNIAGIVGTFISGVIVAKWEKYKKADYIVMASTGATLILLYIAIRVGNIPFLYTSFGLAGLVGISIYGFVYEMLVDVGQPMSEAFVGGIVNLSANLVSFIFVIIFTEILKLEKDLGVLLNFSILVILEVIGMIMMKFVLFKPHRRNAIAPLQGLHIPNITHFYPHGVIISPTKTHDK